VYQSLSVVPVGALTPLGGMAKQKPSDLFACRWLRAPATTEIDRLV
jgi:hypothetical protein